MKKYKSWLVIDALVIRYIANVDLVKSLSDLKLDEWLEFGEFYIFRTKAPRGHIAKRYYYTIHDKEKEIGALFMDNDNNNQWVYVEAKNETLYNGDCFKLIGLEDVLKLQYDCICCLDIALDSTRNFVSLFYDMWKQKSVDVLINNNKVGKSLSIRDLQRKLGGAFAFCSYTPIFSLAFATLRIKQANAVESKYKGATLQMYNKKVEIEDESKKFYILEKYGNPNKLYRLEIHLNKREIEYYIGKFANSNLNPFTCMAAVNVRGLFIYYLNSLLRFNVGRNNIKWEEIISSCEM